MTTGRPPGLEAGLSIKRLRPPAVLADSPLDEGVRQPYQSGQPVRGSGAQPNPHLVSFGQVRHGEQPHVAGYRWVDHGRVIQPLVYLRQPGIGNADPAVADLDQHAPAGQFLG
jgi:hypothetical protein